MIAQLQTASKQAVFVSLEWGRLAGQVRVYDHDPDGIDPVKGAWYLNDLQVKREYRRLGIGSQLMSALVEWADQNHIALSLDAVPLEAVSVEQYDLELCELVKFYARYGFKVIKGNFKDGKWGYAVMHRPARS